jgi:hypothetical protein
MMFNKNARTWDLPAAVCLALIVFLSSYAMELTYWTYDLNRVTSLAMLGLLAGSLIGRSSFSLFFSRMLMSLYSAAFMILQFIIPLNNDPDWLVRVHQYLERVSFTLNQLARNIPLEDGILFLTGAGILFLYSSMIAGFRLMRFGNLWPPFALICGFFYLTQFYLPEFHRNYYSIAIFTILVVFFIGRHTFSKRQLDWQANGIKNDPSVSGYFSRSVLLITIALGFVSWGIPASVKYINEKTQATDRILRQRNSDSWQVLRNFFYPLRQQTGFGEGYFPEILSLGNTRNLKDDEVFQVNVAEAGPFFGRYYWKGRMYDTYEKGTWKNTSAELSDTSAFKFSQQPLPDLEPFVFSIHYLYPREVVFSPQFVLEIDRETNLLVSAINDQQAEIVSIVDYSLVRTGETVRILGGFNSASLPALKAAKAGYPAWVMEKYLQLPEDLPIEVRQLAVDLTENRRTQIEKAQAIIDYLRTSYRYKNFVDIPQGEDPIAWFLFSGLEGFCNYYSTSAVLLMRSAGIPARMVVGYAQGERIEGSDDFRVRIADSHSWVEVYFNDIGWLIMEPTPSQPSVEFPSEEISDDEIGRVEALFLQPPKEGDNTERTKEFFQLSKKYTTEIEEVIEEKNSSHRNLVILLILPGVGLTITGIIYLALFQRNSNQTPFILEKAYKGKHKAPAWIQRWSEFERLIPEEKNFIRLRVLSMLVIKQDPGLLTPREFFAELFEIIQYENSKNISDEYQRILYAPDASDGTCLDQREYYLLLRGILRTWLKRTIKYLKFRLDLGRFGNISS